MPDTTGTARGFMDTSADRALAVVRRCPFCGTVLGAGEPVCPACHERLESYLARPTTQQAYLLEALDRADAGEVDAAARAVRLSLRLDPNALPARRLAARLAASQGDWTTARRHLAVAVALAPGDPDTAALSEAIARGERAAPLPARPPEAARNSRSGPVSAVARPTTRSHGITALGLALGALIGSGVATVAALVARRHARRRD